MANLPLGRGAWTRPFSEGPEVKVVNRFFEENPTNLVDGAALLSRPATNYLYQLGNPVMLATAKVAGTSGNSIVTTTTVTGGSWADMTLTGGAAGVKATGTLTLTQQPSNDETVTIGSTVYTFKTTLTADSTSPFQVLIATTSTADSMKNLVRAVAANSDLDSRAFGASTTAHPDVDAQGNNRIRQIWSQEGTFFGALFAVAGDTLYRIDKDGTITGIAGTLSETGTPIIAGTDQRVFVADGTNLYYYDGNTNILNQITVPDSQSAVHITVLDFFVIVLIANSQRFYWIEPDAVTINALNFAEAEAFPDEGISVRTIGDIFWLFGKQSSEMWYHDTSDADAPFKRQKGVAFTRGIVDGTDVRIDDSRMIVVGDDYIVYLVTNGQPVPISNSGIAERIRNAVEAQFGAILG